jgi:hypothetical protein
LASSAVCQLGLVIFTLLSKICHPLLHAIDDSFYEIKLPLIGINLVDSLIKLYGFLLIPFVDLILIKHHLMAKLFKLTSYLFNLAST